MSACLPTNNLELYKKEGKVVLFTCLERENAAYYGKLTSMIRSMKLRKPVAMTIDGNPHCFILHTSVNEAEYIAR
ncbi:MAG: hypothetical protein QXJ64_04755 [Thermosphaera sp.]